MPAKETAAPAASRIIALDWMRGLVMVLMTIDHASGAFNAGKLGGDSAARYQPGSPLPEAQFLTRWITHLCAPTFVFLAGAALSLSVEKRLRKGDQPGALDRFILTRGLLIAALDPLWMSWGLAAWGVVVFQVLFPIGIGLVCMVPLRRLGERSLLGLSLGLMLGGEALTGLLVSAAGGRPVPLALVLSGGAHPPMFVAYPLLPWLAVMLLGFWFGRRLLAAPEGVPRGLALAGLGSLAVFAAVRGLNGYGNMRLLRDDGSLVQWLHVSKYPPSLTYLTLELGLMALCLAGWMTLARRRGEPAWTKPLLIFGQAAFFFYLLHVHLLKLAALSLGVHRQGGLAEAYAAALGALLVLYPLCAWYRRYKQAHPTGWTRYL
jgi:uncharacterized membrane protein